MRYEYLTVMNNFNRLRESDIAHKPTLDEILEFWLNDPSYHTTNKDNLEEENNTIRKMFDEFKCYLEENNIDEPWIGLDKLGMFPLKWIR